MKLLHYTYRRLSLMLLFLLALWGVLFYYAIMDEVMDETDDMLANYAHILIKQALRDASVVESENRLMNQYDFRPISEEEWEDYHTVYYDSTVYVEIEDEDEPVRVLQTAFRMPDGQYYELTVRMSTLERDDMIEQMLAYLSILFLLFLICTSIGIRLVLKRVFRPLGRLLDWLHGVEPGKPAPPLENHTDIREFRDLNAAAVAMSERGYKGYVEQKQFIENASHELQTPLAIVQGKVELLAESEGLNERQMKELEAICATLSRAVKLNKSLLLLSRIENGQYAESEEVSVDKEVDSLLPDLMDIYAHKQIHLTRRAGRSPFTIRCNPMLAHILVSNLLKNALQHSGEGGELQVLTTESSLEIRNTGDASLDRTRLFQRFYHGAQAKKDSTGLGLSIARSIARASGLSLTYSWREGMHCFRLEEKK